MRLARAATTNLFAKSEGNAEHRCVRGFASTEDLDKDGETVLQKGLDFAPLRDEGFINWDHQKLEIPGVYMPAIIGVPTLVDMRDRGLWVEGELFKAGDHIPGPAQLLQVAENAWHMGQALQKSGRRKLAYSVEGGVLERRGKKVARAVAKHTALTWKPVNSACSVELFAKSLCCGRCSPEHPDYNPAHCCSNKADHGYEGVAEIAPALEKALSTSVTPLLRENLDRGMTSLLYGTPDGCFTPEGRFSKGLAGALDHLSKCRGFDRHESARFLKALLNGATTHPHAKALVVQAGFLKP